MLIARDTTGRHRVASHELRGGQVSCPECGEAVVVRVPVNRVPHFAHPPGKRCAQTLAARRTQARAEREQQRVLARQRQLESTGQAALFADLEDLVDLDDRTDGESDSAQDPAADA